ncbi:anti-sigma factor antagonist [Actinomycetospora sp. NBRC 106375]|uniref:STAS domain-containing protein n=1 Tax=Actinomycetospora sp. NBRC 106375 TaxID=3032207 RepID=UPI0024A5BCBB|nr:STAS domain-containing protein [Actinomycetospora sp. NBRC 106375]GLZ47027.1 anti-sigma factor antagonist [Actinomycetospora sp. NBRC 106375]
MTELTIRTERSDAATVVVVGGDLDYDSHGRLDDAVGDALGQPTSELVLDLEAVTYCDSCGLRVLIGAHRRAEEVGASFALRGVHGQPARALKLTGLDQVFG